MKVILVSWMLLLLCICGNGQTNITADPVIGEPFLGYVFKDVEYFNKKTFNTKEAEGKWLILDFWNETCAACINSFPENDKIYKQYSDKLLFLSVAYTGSIVVGKSSKSSIRKLYEKIKSKYHFSFPVAFDSVLYDKLEIGGVGCPYIVIIDPAGIVKAVVGSIKEKNIAKLIDGDLSDLLPVERLRRKIPITLMENRNVIYSNSISYWDKVSSAYVVRPSFRTDTSTSDHLRLYGMRLDYLYRYAFTGAYNWNDCSNPLYTTFKFYPILEIKDSSVFDPDKSYSFNLQLPQKRTRPELLKIFQNTLRETFGYDVTIENKLVPYWRITLIDSLKTRLITKGEPFSFKEKGKFTGFSAKDVPMSLVVSHLAAHFPLKFIGDGMRRPAGEGRPFIDETGLRENIDVDIDGFLDDFQDFREALLKNGIKIEEGKKMMKCIVIKEVENNWMRRNVWALLPVEVFY